MSIYDTIGVRPIINAKGTSTRVSGALLAPEVRAAMEEAAQYCVDMAEIQAAASKIIAAATGAEAGIVTSGAAAGLLLGTAACVAGLDPAKMARLPDITGMKNEVVMVRSQRNQYDHAIRSAGVHIVEVKLARPRSGRGRPRRRTVGDRRAAVTERTAAIVYVANANARPTIEEVAHVANSGMTCRCSSMLPPNCRPSPTSAALSLPGPTWWPSQEERQSAARKAPASCVARATSLCRRYFSNSTSTSPGTYGRHLPV